ncbi:hypothetical protein [uncultured Hymenobacter sp.]|uniref:hypothetical protein n=1 Tax=uncultured Hymenobacter sp. TaxID=170016 RepID=UPI0035CAB2AC
MLFHSAIRGAQDGQWGRRWWPAHGALLAGLWLLVQTGLLLYYRGPRYAADSWRYLEYAGSVAQHGYYKFADPNDRFVYEHGQRYLVYILFQSFWLGLGAGWWGIVLGQVLASGLAARALYGALRQLAGGRTGAAALATGLFILWPDIQRFNCFLLTESLFISLSVLAFAALVQVWAGGGRAAWLGLGLVLGLTLLARPNGFVVAAAAGVAGLAQLAQRPGRRLFWTAVGLLTLAVPLLLGALNQQLNTFFIVETYARGELMFGARAWAQHPAAALQLPPAGLGQVPRVLYFAAHNPEFLLQLMLGKLFVFASGLKPQYSRLHCLANALVLWPAYWLAARGARRPDVWLPARAFLLAVPLLQAGVVMLTVDDWDVRFLAPVLPFVFGLAALGAARGLAARFPTPPPGAGVPAGR